MSWINMNSADFFGGIAHNFLDLKSAPPIVIIYGKLCTSMPHPSVKVDQLVGNTITTSYFIETILYYVQ